MLVVCILDCSASTIMMFDRDKRFAKGLNSFVGVEEVADDDDDEEPVTLGGGELMVSYLVG